MDLTNNETYIRSCIKVCNARLAGIKSVLDVDEQDVNSYNHLDRITEPRDVYFLDHVIPTKIEQAKKCVLEGRFFTEHAAAGEATRLGLGTKYMINIANDLSAERIAKLISEEKDEFYSDQDLLRDAGTDPSVLAPISLGMRHMLAYSFRLARLAESEGLQPKDVLSVQKMIIIMNEASAERMLSEFQACNFFGFMRKNVFFMIQRSYHGISLKSRGFEYDRSTPKRLHNHGQMVMQETMDNEVFYLEPDGKRSYLKSSQYGELLKSMDDKLSYNIEDMPFLMDPLDLKTLAVALDKKEKGYNMLMEIVANNPKNPQKGGMAAFDMVLGRNVMIESFQLKGLKNADIKFLNKNFNHYPNPYMSWSNIKKDGLNMPITIKHGSIYFQPVQGDINFLVKTEFFQSEELVPILHWKTPATTPLMIKYMHMQDSQEGFLTYAANFVK